MATNNDTLEKNLVIRTMRQDLGRLHRESVLKKEEEEPAKKKEELVKKAPPPLGLPTIERRPPKPPSPPELPPPPTALPPKPPVTPTPPPKPPVTPTPLPKIPEKKPAPPSPRLPERRGKPEIPKVPKAPKRRKPLLLVGIVIALGVAAMLVYWFLFAVPKPPPPPPPPPPPQIEKPIPLIPVDGQIIIKLEEGKIFASELKKQIEKDSPSGLSQILVYYKDSLTPLTLVEIFQEFKLKVPQPLIDNLEKDYTLLLFVQEEFLTETEAPRLGFITQVKNTIVSSQVIRIWESTLAEDLEGFYLVPRGEQATEDFNDNTYKDVDIRFLNFSLPDITIDYALYPEENWLILATSRQFIYRIINLLEEGEIEEL